MATVDPNHVEITEFTIRNLSEFLQAIDDHLYLSTDISSMMLRGESQKFDTRLASIFRNPGAFGQLSQMLDTFQRDTYRLFSAHDSQALMALGQHYGLKTQLLDITNQPLTALYFATKEAAGDGYIYTFDPYFQLDISELYPLNRSITLNDLFLNDPIITKALISKIKSQTTLCLGANFSGILGGIQKFLRELPRELHVFLGGTTLKIYDLEKALNSFMQNEYSEDGYLSLITNPLIKTDLNLIFRQLDVNIFAIDSFEQVPILYVALVIFILSELSKVRLNDWSMNSKCLNFLPQFFYQPLLDDSRVNLQKGQFFVQLPLISTGHIYFVQSVPERYTFRIPEENKAQVSKELQLLGINEKTIFGDPDHIAEYINNTYCK